MSHCPFFAVRGLVLIVGLTAINVGVMASASPPLIMTPIYPRNLLIQPFGYGPVNQFLSKQDGATGSAQCSAVNSTLHCLSVSGGNLCTSPVPANQMISCGPPRPRAVDESRFKPVNCYGHQEGDGGTSGLLNTDDFCLIANYMPGRLADTIYQYDDFVRLGVNRRFGGTAFELYGADKIDRLLQNTGGAMQLSLWAYTAGYASNKFQRAWFAVSSTKDPNWATDFDISPFVDEASCKGAHPGENCELGVLGPNLLASGSTTFPCAPNGSGAGAPYNPLQAMSSGCNVGLPEGRVDSVASATPGTLTVTKTNPFNFTRSDAFAGLRWQQTSQVVGPYVLMTYNMSGTGTALDSSFQEIPAIILHDGLDAYTYFYTGAMPYADVTGPVSRVTMAANQLIALELPNRLGPFGTGASAVLTEDWVSTCDAKEVQCLTVATFSPASQDVIVINTPAAPYFGVHGFFSLTNALNQSVTVAIFPYRFDDVIEGLTVRQWIYQLKQSLNGDTRWFR